MNRRLTLTSLLAMLLLWSCRQEAGTQLVLATTTSVGNAGLLERLLPAYEKEHGVRFGVHLVGSGRALGMLAAGQADLAISHAPEAKRRRSVSTRIGGTGS